MARPRLVVATGACLVLSLLCACGPAPGGYAHFRVIARDYAFGVPPTLAAGETIFHFINEGTVVHEMQLYRFKPGVSRDSALRMLATDNLPDSLIDADGGVLIAGPRDSAVQQLLAPLHRGDIYALECAFRNAPDQPKHNSLGMISVLEVQ